jgi:hypothetical protein
MSRARQLEAAHDDALAHPPPEPAQRCPNKSWIEIRLRDEDGHPAAHEEYKVVAPGGVEIIGRLDAAGFARVTGIDPGSCQVTFPRLHHAEWDVG